MFRDKRVPVTTAFGPKRDEVTGERRELHNEELIDLHRSTNIVRVIKWKRMIWAGDVASMGERRGEAYTWGKETFWKSQK